MALAPKGRFRLTSTSMVSPSLTCEGCAVSVATGGSSSSLKVRSMSPSRSSPCIPRNGAVRGGSYAATPPGSGALMTRVPLDWPGGIVMALAPPAPWIGLAASSARPSHSSVTVCAVVNVTPLVIRTVTVADAPPSTSSVTALPFESVIVSSHAGVAVVRMTVASAPLPMPFTARTSKVYSLPLVSSVKVWVVVVALLPSMSAKVPPGLLPVV